MTKTRILGFLAFLLLLILFAIAGNIDADLYSKGLL